MRNDAFAKVFYSRKICMPIFFWRCIDSNKNYIICESGVKSFEQYQNLISQGFKNFLIGEYFMKSKDTKKELLKFTNEPLKVENY